MGDNGTAEAHASLNLAGAVAIGEKVETHLDRMLRWQRTDAGQRHGSWINPTVSLKAPASGPAVLAFPVVPAGRFWEVMALAVCGSDDHTSLTGTSVALYIGQPPQAGQTPSLSDIYLPAAAGASTVVVPASVEFSRRQCVALKGETVYVSVNGASSGQQLVAVLYAWEFPIPILPPEA